MGNFSKNTFSAFVLSVWRCHIGDVMCGGSDDDDADVQCALYTFFKTCTYGCDWWALNLSFLNEITIDSICLTCRVIN